MGATYLFGIFSCAPEHPQGREAAVLNPGATARVGGARLTLGFATRSSPCWTCGSRPCIDVATHAKSLSDAHSRAVSVRSVRLARCRAALRVRARGVSCTCELGSLNESYALYYMRCSKSRKLELAITLVITLFYYTPITLLAHYTRWGITLPLHSDRGV